MRLLFVGFMLAFYSSICAQNIDLINAPKNPIVLKYKKEHFNLKGDVFTFEEFMFDKNGFLIQEKTFDIGKYLYKNGLPFATTSGQSFYFNANGHIERKTYPFNGFQTETYEYDQKGLLIRVKSTHGSDKVYEYDNKGRLIKSNEYGKIKTYSYQKNGGLLTVYETDMGKTPELKTSFVYKDGHLISQGNYDLKMTFDDNGNPISSYKSSAIYFRDIKKQSNQFSVVYNKPSISSFNKILDCKFFLNGKRIDIIYARIINNKHMMIYDVFKSQYLILEDVFNETKNNTTQNFSKVYMNSNAYLEISSGSKFLNYEGASITNSIYLPNTYKVITQSNYYICYDANLNKTLFNKFDPTKSFTFYPLQELNSKDNILFIKEDGKVMTIHQGKVLNNSDYTIAFNNTDGVLFKAKAPTYYLPDYKEARPSTIYPGRKYNSQTDTYKFNDSKQVSNSINNNASKNVLTSGCISGNCSDGYGTYKFENGTTIEGFFSSGKSHGYAIQIFANGDRYTGNYAFGNKSGFGIYYWQASGSQYYGEWYNNTMNGYGYVVTNDKTTQAGIYSDGKLIKDMLNDYKNGVISGSNCLGNCTNGYGSIKYDNGDIYSGFFNSGKRYKVGQYQWVKINTFYIGQYGNNGNREGTGMYVDQKSIYFGVITGGELTGKAVVTYRDTENQIYGEFSRGKLIKDYKNN